MKDKKTLNKKLLKHLEAIERPKSLIESVVNSNAFAAVAGVSQMQTNIAKTLQGFPSLNFESTLSKALQKVLVKTSTVDYASIYGGTSFSEAVTNIELNTKYIGLIESIETKLSKDTKLALGFEENALGLAEATRLIHSNINVLEKNVFKHSNPQSHAYQLLAASATIGLDPKWLALGGANLSTDMPNIIKFGEYSISKEEVEDSIRGIESNSSGKKPKDISELLIEIVELIKSFKETKVQLYLAYFVLPLIVTIVGGLINTQINQKLLTPKSKLIYEQSIIHTKKNATVSAKKGLHVRHSANTKSKIISTLSFGDEVVVLEKRRRWVRIKWTSEHGTASLEGWVFSKYLKTAK